jgi:HSP20 family protein
MNDMWDDLTPSIPRPFPAPRALATQSFMRGDPFLDMDMVAGIGPIYSPAFDLIETTETFMLLGDLPGLAMADLDIELVADNLTIIGERDAEDLSASLSCHALERTFGSFMRTFVLPRGVAGSKCYARMEAGVLRVEVPKLFPGPPQVQARARASKGGC